MARQVHVIKLRFFKEDFYTIAVTLYLQGKEELMQSKISWIDNLRGIACLMVVMIHDDFGMLRTRTVSALLTGMSRIFSTPRRVGVPLFFMIRLSLFWRARSAQPRHLFVSPRVSAFIAPSR